MNVERMLATLGRDDYQPVAEACGLKEGTRVRFTREGAEWEQHARVGHITREPTLLNDEGTVLAVAQKRAHRWTHPHTIVIVKWDRPWPGTPVSDHRPKDLRPAAAA